VRPVDLIVDFPGAAFFKPFFRLTTVFFAISRPVALVGTLEAPGSQVETGARLLTLNVRDGVAGSTGRRNTGIKSLCWRFKLQGLTWSLV